VQRVDLAWRGPFQYPVLDHRPGALAGLLGRLEDEHDPARQLLAQPREDYGDTQSDRRVQVVAAEVRHPRYL